MHVRSFYLPSCVPLSGAVPPWRVSLLLALAMKPPRAESFHALLPPGAVIQFQRHGEHVFDSDLDLVDVLPQVCGQPGDWQNIRLLWSKAGHGGNSLCRVLQLAAVLIGTNI